MIQLHQTAAEWLTHLDPEQQKSLLLWFAVTHHVESTVSPGLQALMDEVSGLDAEACYDQLSRLDLTEQIQFSLVNEFGAGVANKSYFASLTERIHAQLMATLAKY